ncbi:hypothetical protein Pmani_000820 [Petrolisthes manimaculis]|uniref:DUF4371 domain-containing protein n=1 Tax=Petrolisthes manimaculis TaxID=1843537 RepID=A0AAE1QL85_9EUCA|nr:hypothetical protein Pmani_000820 [Petrolisthes manimaculis]
MMMEHNLSFRTADHMADVLKDCFPDSDIAKDIKFKRTKCQSVAENVLAASHKENLADTLRQSKFRILVDESTDVSTSQNVVIMVRFPEDQSVVTKFWDLVPIFSPEDLADAVEDPVNALSNQGYHEQSIVPLAIKLPRIISQDETSLQQLDQEWRRLSIEDLPQHINDMAKKTVKIKYRNPDKFWGAVQTIMDSDGEQKFNTVRE